MILAYTLKKKKKNEQTLSWAGPLWQAASLAQGHISPLIKCKWLGNPWGCNCLRYLPLTRFAACNFVLLAEDYPSESASCSYFSYLPLPAKYRFVCEGDLKDPAVCIGCSLTWGNESKENLLKTICRAMIWKMSLTLLIPSSNKLINTAQSNDTELPAFVKMEVKAISFNLDFSLPSPAKPHLPVVSQCPPAAPHQTNSFLELSNFLTFFLALGNGTVRGSTLIETAHPGQAP